MAVKDRPQLNLMEWAVVGMIYAIAETNPDEEEIQPEVEAIECISEMPELREHVIYSVKKILGMVQLENENLITLDTTT